MTTTWTVLLERLDFRGVSRMEVRAWEAGDGLRCTTGRGNRNILSCGRPVAVIRTTSSDGTRLYVACATHLANKARQAAEGTTSSYRVTTVSGDAARKAGQEVLANHWEEYQQAVLRISGEVRESWLSALPASLREACASCEMDEEVSA